MPMKSSSATGKASPTRKPVAAKPTASKAAAPKLTASKAAAPKLAAKAASASVVTGGRGPLPGGGNPTPTIDPTVHRGWDSGELQQQIGSKNKDKKKLVMQVWYEYAQNPDTSYRWSVQCHLKAEDKKLVGSGWKAANSLASVSYNLTYKQGSAAPVSKASSQNFVNRSDTTVELISGTAANTALLPVFQTKHVTGSRSGGPSGISLAW